MSADDTRAQARSGLEIAQSFLRKKYGLPKPTNHEEVIGGAQ